MVRVPVLSLFGPALFRVCDLLVVQTDAWERYGERATRCFEFGAAGQGRQQSRKRGSCGRADDLSKR